MASRLQVYNWTALSFSELGLFCLLKFETGTGLLIIIPVWTGAETALFQVSGTTPGLNLELDWKGQTV